MRTTARMLDMLAVVAARLTCSGAPHASLWYSFSSCQAHADQRSRTRLKLPCEGCLGPG